MGFPFDWNGEESAFNAGDLGSIPGSGRSPGEENGNSLQYSCLENPMERGAWWATVHGGHKVSDMTERLTNTNTQIYNNNIISLKIQMTGGKN